MKEIQWERIAAILLSLTLGSVALYLFFKYLFPVFLPFLIAYLVSLFIRPVSKKLSALLHLPQKLISCLLLGILIVGGAYLLWILAVKLIEEAGTLIGQLLRDGTLTDALESVRGWLLPLAERLGIDLLDSSEGLEKTLSDFLYSALASLGAKLPDMIGALFSSLPSVFLLVAITLVAGFYLSADGERITAAIINVLPSTLQNRLFRLRAAFKELLGRYLKAYFDLFLLTFVLLLVGFLILRVEYALLFSLLVAFADFLPVLGVGTILIPWGLIAILQKDYYLGFGLLILYLVISLIRQFAEPRLIGKSLGLHPLLALLSTYAGLVLFGFWGMLLGPAAAILFKGIAGAWIRGKEK